MNKIYYIKHYFDFRNAGSFLLVSFVGLFLVLAVVLVAARIQTALNARRHAQNASDDTLYQVRKKHFTLILYFITLAAGRFLYFDFTWKDFSNTIRCLCGNLPLLLLMSLYSGMICWYGFHENFLLKSNGVIISTLIAHLFMDLSIFVLHYTKLLKFFIPSQPKTI